MTDQADYRDAASHALAGFQLIEASLKQYIGYYHDAVRHLVCGKLSYKHKQSDIDEAPIERLLKVFAKINSNDLLIRNLRKLVKHRNEIAHKALVHLYHPTKSDEEFEKLKGEMIQVAEQLSRLLGELNGELLKVGLVLHTNDPCAKKLNGN